MKRRLWCKIDYGMLKSGIMIFLFLLPVQTMAQRTLTIALAGDVMLGRGVNEVLLKKGTSFPWGNILPRVKKADFFAFNLECVISDKGAPWVTTPKVFHFRALPPAIESLKMAGVDYVSIANNHSLDYDVPALLDMMERLKKARIPFAGAGKNRTEAAAPAIVEKKGTKAAFISVTDNTPEWAAKENAPGVNYMPIALNAKTRERLKEMILAAKKHQPDLIVFSAHWGPNMRKFPSQNFIDFAHAVMDAGVDIFHGHSAHVFQGVEIYKGKPILYDTGDLIDDYQVSEYIDQQMLYFLNYDGKKLKQIDLYPVELDYAAVRMASGDVFRAVAERLKERSKPFGTTISVQKDRFVIFVK